MCSPARLPALTMYCLVSAGDIVTLSYFCVSHRTVVTLLNVNNLKQGIITSPQVRVLELTGKGAKKTVFGVISNWDE